MRYVLGVTGGIGSGKSTVTDWFAKQGIGVVDADEVATCVLKSKEALNALSAHLGAWVVQDGRYNRTAMKAHLARHPDAFTTLNSITHPLIRTQIVRALEHAKGAYVILSAPLLFETGLNTRCNRCLVVDIPKQIQLKRALARGRQDKHTICAIMDSQLSRAQRLELADDVVDNSQDIKALYQALAPLHSRYLQEATKGRGV